MSIGNIGRIFILLSPLVLEPATSLGKTPTASMGSTKKDACTQDPSCQEMSDKALMAYQTGEYMTALSLYQAAYAKYPLARILYNIGRSQHKLLRFTEAEQAYRSFLVQSPDEDLRKKAQDFLSEIQRERTNQEAPKPDTSTTQNQPKPASNPEVLQSSIPPQQPTVVVSSDTKVQVPIYKRWWFWTAVGGGIVAITAIGLGVGLSRRAQMSPTDLNLINF